MIHSLSDCSPSCLLQDLTSSCIPSLSVFDLDFSIGHLEAACKTDRCLKFVKLQSEGKRGGGHWDREYARGTVLSGNILLLDIWVVETKTIYYHIHLLFTFCIYVLFNNEKLKRREKIHHKGKRKIIRTTDNQLEKVSNSNVVVQPLSRVHLFTTLWTVACQAPLSLMISQSLLRLRYSKSVMLSKHLILCNPLLPPSVYPSIRVFSSDLALWNR